MKNTPMLLLLILIPSGCATTSTSHILQGRESELRQTTTVAVELFLSGDESIAQAVQDTIIEMLLPSGVGIVNDSGSADVVIQGSITFSDDSVSAGGAYSGQTAGSAYTRSTAGRYVSGITAQLVKHSGIIAAASETQVRTPSRIPDPPVVIARRIGRKIKKLLRR